MEKKQISLITDQYQWPGWNEPFALFLETCTLDAVSFEQIQYLVVWFVWAVDRELLQESHSPQSFLDNNNTKIL
jgi:hypothetical protein